MRAAPWISLGFLILSSSPLRAQGVLFTATVSAPEAEVRAGPSSNPAMYVTNRLRKGDRVEVLREMDEGWLAIRPPAGSFSWIHSRYVQQNGPTRPAWWTVTSEKMAPLLLGSNIKMDKPTVEGVKVKRGTQLHSVGPMKLADDGYWLPVEAPPGEVRYIRASDVTKAGDAPTATTPPLTAPPTGPPGVPEKSPVGGAPPVFSPGVVVPPTSTSPPSVAARNDPRWLRAEEAERAGRIVEAIQLYRNLGTQLRNVDEDLAGAASNRAQWLEERLRKQNAAPQPNPGTDARYPGPAATTPAVPAGMVTSNPGTLERAGNTIDNRPTYILLNSQRIPILYAQPYPGISLEPYADRVVQLIGTLQQRSDVRAWVMTVSQVRVLQ